MKPLNERDLERLLGELPDGETLTPPADLADRIKAEIPADLADLVGAMAPANSVAPQEADDESDKSSEETREEPTVVVGPWSRQRRWALAASLVTLLGAGIIARNLLLDSTGSGPVSDLAVAQGESVTSPEAEGAQPADARDFGILRSTPSTAGPREATADESQRFDARKDDVGERATRGESAETSSPEVARSAVARSGDATAIPDPAPQVDADLALGEELRRAIGPRANQDRPSAPADPAGRTANRPEAKILEGQLQALGYVGGDGSEVNDSFDAELEEILVTSESPALPSPPPPPPLAPRAPTIQPASGAQPPPLPPGRARRQAEVPKPTAQAQTHDLLFEAEPVDRQLAAPSTGGTAEPNDQPYGDVFFRSEDTNPFLDTEDDRLSTFGFDVDTASYSVARRFLRDGHLPPHEAIRVEEFVNSFDYGDPRPEEGDFALHAEGSPSPFGEGERYYLLRLNASGRVIDDSQRAPAQLTFVVDVSGSMGQENRLRLVKRALGLLLDQLRSDDSIALVVYGSRGRVVLDTTSDHGAIRRAIDQLQTEGSTNAEEGLRLAYELAARNRKAGVINRVILCSDGVANVGRTSAESILEQIARHAQQGIELTTVGFGMGNYNDVLMEQLANWGNGRYAYVDTLDEAHKIFVEDLTGTLQTLAAEARAQVEFDPELVERYRLLGYENRDIADERFRDDTVDAGEIGMGHRVTALYELKLRRPPRRRDRLATFRVRFASVVAGEMVEIERGVTGADFVERWERGSTALRLTTLVAEFAEILRGSYWAREGDLDEVFRRTQRLSADLAGDTDVAELVDLMGKAAALQARTRGR